LGSLQNFPKAFITMLLQMIFLFSQDV